MPDCMACGKPFVANLDTSLCDTCVHEAYRHKPDLYAQITLVGFGSYIQPLNEVSMALSGEFDGAEEGAEWKITLISMTRAEYDALEEFAGH